MKTLEDYEKWFQNSLIGIGSPLDEREINEALKEIIASLDLDRKPRLHDQLETINSRRRARRN